jgi:CHASE3 domain sensor protein
MEQSFLETTETVIHEEQRNTNALFGFTFLVIFAVGVVFVLIAATRAADFELVLHTQKVLSTISDVESSFRDADIEGRDGILTGTPREETKAMRAAAIEHLSRFRELTQDNPRQQANAQKAAAVIERRFATVDFLTEMSASKGLNAATAFMKANYTMNELRAVSSVIRSAQDEEQRLLFERTQQADESRVKFTVWGLLIWLLLIAAVAVARHYTIVYMKRRLRAAQIFRKAYVEAKTGTDGVLEIKKDTAEKILEFFEHYEQAA